MDEKPPVRIKFEIEVSSNPPFVVVPDYGATVGE